MFTRETILRKQIILRKWFFPSKNCAETGTSNSSKVPSLENVVDVVAHPIQAALVLASYQTCMGSRIILVAHYTFSIDQFWCIFFCITSFVQLIAINFRINRCVVRGKHEINNTLEIPPNGQHNHFFW